MSSSPIGSATSRIDARLKVTGGALYAADNNPTGLCYGYLILSTIGKGTITAMNTSAATSAPGVLAVYTPFNPVKLYAYGGDENDEFTPPLQDANVRYYGQVIGLVVAQTFEQARDAAELVTTSYSSQTPTTAFPGAPTVPAAATVSQTYTTSMVHHHAMEPHATVASWSSGHLTIYTATQGTPLVVSRLANALGVAGGNIHVINPYVGGAFGGKWGNWAHTPLTAAAAQALNKPIKTVLTREQVFTVVGHRPMTSQTVTIAASSDGTITSLTHDGTASKSNSSNFTEGPSTVSNITYAAGSITTNKSTVDLDIPATTIMRAPSEANGSFALECAIDELAVELNMDPLALRQKNYANTVPNGGKPWSSKHLAECYTTGATAFDWSKRNPAPGQVLDGDWYVGLGMATAIYQASRSNATLKVRLRSDGTALVAGTGSDAGTGQATVFAILGAVALGIPVAQVTAQLGDSTLPTAANAGGSSSFIFRYLSCSSSKQSIGKDTGTDSFSCDFEDVSCLPMAKQLDTSWLNISHSSTSFPIFLSFSSFAFCINCINALLTRVSSIGSTARQDSRNVLCATRASVRLFMTASTMSFKKVDLHAKLGIIPSLLT